MPKGIYIRTKQNIENLSKVHKNLPSPMLGKHHTKNAKKLQSKFRKNKTYEEIYGVKNAKEQRKIKVRAILGNKNPMKNPNIALKVSLSLKNRKLTEEHKNSLSESHKGIKYSKERNKKISKKNKIILNTPEIKAKIRQKAVQRILLNNGYFPSYSKQQVEFFKSYDKQHNTNGQYATNPHEHYIKELGYWPDYINFDKKLIMEYDEKHHYNKNDKLKKEDIIRQKEIQDFYPEFKFIRIKENAI